MIYIFKSGKELGPFDEREIRRHWANGVLDADDLAWSEGMVEWVALKHYFGIPRSSSVDFDESTRIPKN
ncbi:MAG: DUF4339 domain-containing protein [Candidatus Methylacidiphilales bacterium]